MRRTRKKLDDQQVRALARKALGRIAASDDPAAMASRALAQLSPAQVRQFLVEISTTAAERITHAVLSAALNSGDEALARLATELVVDLNETATGQDLLRKAFEAADPALRRRAVEALESFTDPQLLSLLGRALSDSATAVRRSATDTFGIIIGTPGHRLREGIVDRLSDPESELARAIISNDDTLVRRQVVQSLAYGQTDQALPTLERLAHDSDQEVREELVLTLAASGSQAAVALMGKMLSDPSERVASTALDMLAATLGAASPDFLQYLGKALDHPTVEVRRHAALMLSPYPPSKIKGILQKAADDSDFEVSLYAGEMLRKLGGTEGIAWVAEEMQGQIAGHRTQTIWEAANIAHETGRAAGETQERINQMLPLIEQTLENGASSEKVHALNELSSLVDIRDSSAMQAALYDRDASVRSRAAETLSYTRDAGLLVELLHTHEDAMVRRRAIEALSSNPGGPAQKGRLATSVTFTSQRTAGVELFSHFLAALNDPDTDVQQSACEAIRDTVRRGRLLPVRRTLQELSDLVESEDTSALLTDDAEYAMEMVQGLHANDLLVQGVQEALDWRKTVAREAHSVRREPGSGAITVKGVGGEAVERWSENYHLDAAQAEELQQAASDGSPLGEAVSGKVLIGLAKDLGAALRCVASAARAIHMIGQEGNEEELQNWATAVSSGPELDWGDSARVRSVIRLRRQAWLEAMRARASFDPEPDWAFLDELRDDDDDWVKMIALAAQEEVRPGSVTPEAMKALCRRHEGERDFAEPVAHLGLLLLKAGAAEGVGYLRAGLSAAGLGLRLELAHVVAGAAQEEAVGRLLLDEIEGRRCESPADVCLAMGARGAGLDTGDVEREATPEAPEMRCALLGLRAMGNDAEAAEELEGLLRSGTAEERYLSASYLGLARVWTATLMYSSVRGQGSSYSLQLLCSANLVRRGHSDGLLWFEKIARSVSGRAQAERVTHMGLAIQDVIPVMLQCQEVNAGRFV